MKTLQTGDTLTVLEGPVEADNLTGRKLTEQRYTAWGATRYVNGNMPTEYSYTGQYSYTGDFGLIYYNARWYDPALGRFAQADSIVPVGVQGMDRYAYGSITLSSIQIQQATLKRMKLIDIWSIH